MKKIAIITALALVMTTGMATVASANTTSLVNSGSGTTVNTSDISNLNVNTVNTNVANVTQALNSSNVTGQNTSVGNIGATPCGVCGITGGSSIVTGNAQTNNSMEVAANNNVTAINVAGNAAGNQTDAVNTGSGLNLNTLAVSNVNVNVANTNLANLTQVANVSNLTGQNTSANNVGSANLVTGNAGVNNHMEADVNSNGTAINVALAGMPTLGGCNLCGMPCAGANCTSLVNSGSNSNFNALSVSNNSVNVLNTNVLTSLQALTAANNSGQNASVANIYGANLVTGSAGVANHMEASGNENFNAINIASTMPMGTNDLIAVNSGLNANVNTQAVSNTNVLDANTNVLTVNELVNAYNLSGMNAAVSNIGGGTLWTGGTGTGNANAVGGNSNVTVFGNATTSLMALLTLMAL